MQNTEKFLACDQEKGSLLKTVSSLTKEKVSLEKSVEELQSQLAAKQADGDAQIAVVKAQLKAAQDEAEAVKARADKAEKHVEKTKELHLGAQEQSDLLQAQITRLYVDLKARQENLEEATSAHDALTSQLKAIRSEGDGSRRDLEAQLAAATKAASSEKMGLQVCSRCLKAVPRAVLARPAWFTDVHNGTCQKCISKWHLRGARIVSCLRSA